jgi:hypothetical protein
VGLVSAAASNAHEIQITAVERRDTRTTAFDIGFVLLFCIDKHDTSLLANACSELMMK